MNSLASTPNSRVARADGINWAWQNGADIINNSWAIESISGRAMIDDAINNAITYGRNGKGTILVCGSGNYPPGNKDVQYPAVSKKTIAVGATLPRGYRVQPGQIADCPSSYWGSCYNTTAAARLDVVAPGWGIATTDRVGSLGYTPEDYYLDFEGTSASTAYVSGVVALMLSVNPCLRHDQVKDIIREYIKH